MTTSISNQYIGQPAATDTTLYTCPNGRVARVIKCTVTNDTTTPANITFHKVSSGGSVGDDKLILNGRIVKSKETYECPEVVGQVLNTGDFLSAVASVVDQLTVAVDIVEIVT